MQSLGLGPQPTGTISKLSLDSWTFSYTNARTHSNTATEIKQNGTM